MVKSVLGIYKSINHIFSPYFKNEALLLSNKIDYDIFSFDQIGNRTLLNRLINKLAGNGILGGEYNFNSQLLAKTDRLFHFHNSKLIYKVQKDVLNNVISRAILTFNGKDLYIDPLHNKDWHAFLKKYLKEFKAIQVMSEDQKKLVCNYNVDNDRVYVIPRSFNSGFKSISKEKIDDRILNLCSVFRFCWEKNIFFNLLFIKKLKQKGINIKYSLVGSGELSEQIKYLSWRFGLESEITILEPMPQNELFEFYSSNDLILQLSQSESLGATVVEAQSIGLPALVSNVGGLPEIVIHKKTGLVLDDDWNIDKLVDETLELWTSKNLYNEFSKNAIRNSENVFSEKIIIEKYLEMYEDIA